MHDDDKQMLIHVLKLFMAACLYVGMGIFVAHSGLSLLRSNVQESLVVLEELETITSIPTVRPTEAVIITPIPTQAIIQQETTVIYEAERIDYTIPLMAVIILIVVVIVLVFIVFMYKLHVDKKKKEMEYNKQILQMELHTFEQEAVNKLKEKYENQKRGSSYDER
ncbi:MAG: hypothetical protein J6J42_02400 [Lachnospiraceae bacterium]|nr:hypothetical protein [Lachnospiraceae bacterium]